MNGKVHDYIKLGYLTIVLSILVYFIQGILLNADIITNRVTFIHIDVSAWLFVLGLLTLAKSRRQTMFKKTTSEESANPRNKTKNDDVESQTEKKDIHFSYELFRIVFLSLLLSTFVGVMEEAPKENLDFSVLASEYLSLFFPIIVGVLIYREAYISRKEFERSSQILAYCMSVALFACIMMIYYEIFPVLMRAVSFQDFLTEYTESVNFYPSAVIALCILYPWFYESLFKKTSGLRYFPSYLTLALYLPFILGRWEKLFGKPVGLILYCVFFVILMIIRLRTDHRPTYDKNIRERLRKLKIK